MKAVVERVKRARLWADGCPHSEIGAGLLVFLGVEQGDDEQRAALLARKIKDLRVFCDKEGKMNLSAQDLGREILAVSNFTLCADTRKGNRPSFINAMAPEDAKQLYEYFISELSKNLTVKTGVFGADMEIENICDGPVTITLDTGVWLKNA